MIAGSVVAALVTRFTTASASLGAVVYTALPVTAAPDEDVVLVGHDGDIDSDTSTTVEYEWANLAATSRYEIGSVPCAVISQSGDDDMQARFAQAQLVLRALENSLVADLSLSGLVMIAHITSGGLRPLQNQGGARVLCPFYVTYRAQV